MSLFFFFSAHPKPNITNMTHNKRKGQRSSQGHDEQEQVLTPYSVTFTSRGQRRARVIQGLVQKKTVTDYRKVRAKKGIDLFSGHVKINVLKLLTICLVLKLLTLFIVKFVIRWNNHTFTLSLFLFFFFTERHSFKETVLYELYKVDDLIEDFITIFKQPFIPPPPLPPSIPSLQVTGPYHIE